jgi:hypothetical protein
MVAALMHGDIGIKAEGTSTYHWGLAIDPHSGRRANSVPLNSDPSPPLPSLDAAAQPKAKPIHVPLGKAWLDDLSPGKHDVIFDRGR